MQHISNTASLRVNAPVDETLPLFTAAGERLWVPDWNPIYVYPESGEPETGMVWKTHLDDHAEAVWLTVNYDTVHHRATYVKWTPEKHVTRIDIQCEAATEDKTSVQVTYTLTALGESGHADLRNLTRDHYETWIESWEKAINHYLERGEMLQPA